MKKLLVFAFSLIWQSNFAFSQIAKLDAQEVNILKEIREKLGIARNMRWDLENPCSKGNWYFTVECQCHFETNTTCRVVGLYIKSQNISTLLPAEFHKLRYLQNLDLTRNYFSGSIPAEWATMRLSILTLMGNRLSGPFPIALTKMTALEYLDIEGNHFSGPIPEEIGNLKNLTRLFLSSNDFTGELPRSFAKLTNLTYLRISSSNITGKIPNFIVELTRLGILQMQGCSLEGPLPSRISDLRELNDLRISDLKGGPSTFPPLEKMTALNILILRNCLIHGTIPEYLGNLRNLKILDLSFNDLTGRIPSSFSQLEIAESIYLTENKLTGPIPRWVLSSTKDVDCVRGN